MLKKYSTLVLFFLIGFFTNSNHTYSQGPKIKIMPLGNSITQGQATENQTSYRRHLWVKLNDNGYSNIEFIGTMNNPWGTDQNEYYNDYDKRHEGHASWTANHILNGWTSPPQIPNYTWNPDYDFDDGGIIRKGGKLSMWLEDYNPDIALVHLGTNDAFVAADAKVVTTVPDFETYVRPGIKSNLIEVITTLQEYNPHVTVLIAQLIPTTRGGSINGINNRFITSINSIIPDIVDETDSPYSRVILVDQNTGFDPDLDTYDRIHPNTIGSVKMADKWFEKLNELFQSNLPVYAGTRFGVKHLGTNGIFKDINFDLDITNAHDDASETLLSGNFNVTITTNNPVDNTLVFAGNANFFNGVATVEISLANIGEHILNVNISGIAREEKSQILTVFDTYAWNGTTSSDWYTPSNWAENAIPPAENAGYAITINPGPNPPVLETSIEANNLNISANAELIVGEGGTLTIRDEGLLVIKPGGKLTVYGTLTNNATADGFLIESDASKSGSVIINHPGVQATVERYLKGRTWHIISPPVSGETLEEFLSRNPITKNTIDNVFAIQHLEESTGWSDFYATTITGPMVSGKAYNVRIQPSDGGVITFKGELITGDIALPITRDGDGWNAIGNPFSSSIGVTLASDVDGFLTQNVDELDTNYAGLYVFDTNEQNYKIINNVPQTDDLRQDYISSGQGFIVRSRNGGGTASLKKEMQQHIDAIFYKKIIDSGWSIFDIKVDKWDDEDQQNSTQTRIALHKQMTKDLDVTFDAGNYNPDTEFYIYTKLPDSENDIKLGIQALPNRNLSQFEIPLGLKNLEGGYTEFSVINRSLPEYIIPYLIDKESNTTINLLSDNYLVYLPAAYESEERFVIQLKDNRTFFSVTFGIPNFNGYIKVFASNDNYELESGDEVPQGEKVFIQVTPNENYIIDNWKINGETVEGYRDNYLEIVNINEDINIHVDLKSLLSSDAILNEILIDNESLNEFDPNTFYYFIELAHDINQIPQLEAQPAHPNASIKINQATNLMGTTQEKTASIEVTAENGIDQKLYEIEFQVKEIQMYPVYFGTASLFGDIYALVDDQKIVSGDHIPKNKNIIFKAEPEPDYEILHWVLDGQIVENEIDSTYIYTNLDKSIDVKVSFTVNTTSVFDSEANNIQIYYTHNHIYIKQQQHDFKKIVIYDVLGRILLITDLSGDGVKNINVESFKEGLYVVHLLNDTSKVVKKLIIK